MQLGKDVQNVFHGFGIVLTYIEKLVKAQRFGELESFIGDTRNVVEMFLNEAMELPADFGQLTPFPKNFFSQLDWIRHNYTTVSSVANLSDPFKGGRESFDGLMEKYSWIANL